MMVVQSLGSAVQSPGLGAMAPRRPARARRALRTLAQSEKPQGARIRPERDESLHHFPIDNPPKDVYAQEGEAAKRLEATKASAPHQQTQWDGEGVDYDMEHVLKQCSCKEKKEGRQKAQADERVEANERQTQWDGEGQDYDMEDVMKYSKERGNREKSQRGERGRRQQSQGGETGGKGGVGEEAGVQDVE